VCHTTSRHTSYCKYILRTTTHHNTPRAHYTSRYTCTPFLVAQHSVDQRIVVKCSHILGSVSELHHFSRAMRTRTPALATHSETRKRPMPTTHDHSTRTSTGKVIACRIGCLQSLVNSFLHGFEALLPRVVGRMPAILLWQAVVKVSLFIGGDTTDY